MSLKFEKLTTLNLKNHPTLNEKWVQDRIAEDPSLLGLGSVELKDRERIQPRSGRLDLLFQESDGHTRYEVEIQLGKTDESHIIRIIEYWASLSLTVLCMGLLLSASALKSYALTEGDYTYTVTNGQATITAFRTSYTGSLLITNSLGTYPVVSIGASAFEDCSGLKSVAIPSGVTNIGDWAFCSCYTLVTVKVGTNVTAIGYCAFYKCDSLTSVFFEGNAPARCNGTVFTYSSAIIYYQPNTAGWGTSLGGLQTLCWNPTIRSDAGFGFASDRFGFNIAGTANIPVTVEACTNLSAGVWTPLTNATLGAAGSFHFNDPSSTNLPARFYRIVWP